MTYDEWKATDPSDLNDLASEHGADEHDEDDDNYCGCEECLGVGAFASEPRHSMPCQACGKSTDPDFRYCADCAEGLQIRGKLPW